MYYVILSEVKNLLKTFRYARYDIGGCYIFTRFANLQPFLLYFIDWHIFLPKKYKIEWGLYIQQMRRADSPSHLI